MKHYMTSVLLLLACQAAYSAPEFNTSTNFYLITGLSARDLHASMRALGPLQQGIRYDADTKYYVKWRFYAQPMGASCVLKNIRVTVDTVYTFPRWQNYSDAALRLQHNWDAYYAKLEAHERRHGSHGANAAIEIEARLLGMPAMLNCDELTEAANRDAYAILHKYQQADVDYDQETDHGIKQGVTLSD